MRPALVVLVLAACGGSGSMTGQAAPPPLTVPAQFVPDDPGMIVPGTDTTAGAACVSPLIDRATGTRLMLYRSESGVGDYQPPSGAFGIPDGKLIRIECNTGRVLGIVRR